MRVTDLLRTMDIFESLPAEQLETIARLLLERRLAEEEVLCRESEPGDGLFIVTGGRIRLTTADPAGREKVLTYFSDGQFFGEMALLTGSPRSATATAETESRVLVLRKRDFDQLLSTDARIMREMLKVVSQRTVQTNQQLLAEDGAGATTTGGGRIYAVFSPRGGSGKTTLAVNLAVLLARQMPERVALLDLDLTFAHAALLLNLAPETSLAAVPPESLDQFDRQALTRHVAVHPSGLHLLAGANRPEEGEAVSGEHVRAALLAMKRQYLAVVVDCSPLFNDPTLAALELADRIVVLCTPELSTLHDVRQCQRIFGEVIHVDRSRLYFALNHYQPFKVLTRRQFETALEQPMALEIPHAGDAAVKAALKGEPLVTLGGAPAYVKSLQRMVSDLETPEVKAVRQKAAKMPSPATGQHGTARRTARTGAAGTSRGLFRLFRRA